MAQPRVGQEALEPDVFGGGADGGEAEAEHDGNRPRAERTPFDAAVVPVGAAEGEVHQVLGP